MLPTSGTHIRWHIVCECVSILHVNFVCHRAEKLVQTIQLNLSMSDDQTGFYSSKDKFVQLAND